MLVRAFAVWITGLLTAVPYATHYLLFHAEREQYALLITFILFWICGYWGVVGPLIAALKVRRVFRALEQVTSRQDLVAVLKSPEARDVAIELIASENRIPRFLAARVYRLLVERR
jgi:hypothetical protein